MLLSIAAFIAVFTIVVLVHELGHFLAARRAGVRVHEFSVGFPFSPRIITLFRHRETDFTLRLLPLGGFVGFSQEGEGDAPGFFEASRLHRLQILSAGPVFNVVFAFLALLIVYTTGKDMSPGAAAIASAKTVWAVISGTVEYAARAFTGQGSMDALAGPVGIAVIAGKAAAEGFLNLLYFTGMLSLSLGIMNLFPLPALDGGQLLMLLIETVRKKPLGLNAYRIVNTAGLAIFFFLAAVVTYRDIVKMIA